MSEHNQQSQPDPAAFIEPAGQPGQPERRAGDVAMIALVWVLVVAVTASVGWFVVDRAGGSLLEASGLGFAGSSGSGTPTSAVSTAGTPSGSLSTSGGRVFAVCTSKGIALQYATPAQGWRMQVQDARPDRLRVEFEKGGGSSTKVEVEGRCLAGTPRLTQGGHGADDATHPAASPTATVDDHGGRSGSGQGGGSGSGSGSDSGSGSGKSSGGSGKATSGSGGGGSDDGGGDDSGGSGKSSGGSSGSGKSSGGSSGSGKSSGGSAGGGSGGSGGSGKSSGGGSDDH